MARDSSPDIVSTSDIFAEFVGTFTLIFLGAGSIIATGTTNLVAVAIAHGFALVIMITALAHVSGAHFNPAVTFGAYITQKISGRRTLIYWATQLVGATVAALLLKSLTPKAAWKPVHLGAVTLGPGTHTSQGILIEAILTFFLVWVVFAVAIDEGNTMAKVAGVVIGTTVMADIMMGGSFTGAAMNPARAFGPALVDSEWKNFGVWVVGPLLGGALAAVSYDRLILRPRQRANA